MRPHGGAEVTPMYKPPPAGGGPHFINLVKDVTSMDKSGITAVVDARGLSCPMPVLRVRKAMADVEPGEVLKVVATDRGALKDIPAWARTAGHEIVSVEEAGEEIHFTVRRGK